ncbi:MAG: DUF370 domain-containing protein [Armatimonadetes bacterium]|nr:DUF370 domain-containing protein [Armatimonadota bacterium]
MNAPRLLSVGFADFVPTDKVVAPVSIESAPMRRLIQLGWRTKSVMFTTDSIIVLQAVPQETLAKRRTSGESVSDGA